jgi:signal transduction histidine kinase
MRPIVALALLVLAPTLALGAERASPKEAELMVHKAVEFLNKEGKEKALAVFNDSKGPFTYRDLYIIAYDSKGTCLAHPLKRERVGKNNLEDKDADGHQFVKERVEIAARDGKGWQQYKWQNPANKMVEVKVAFFEKVGDVILVAGAYKP